MYQRQRGSRGFSMIEMLVVIAMIGIMSLVTVPAFMQYQRSQLLKNSLRMFTSDLRAARARAVTRTSIVRVRIDHARPAPGRYVIEESTNNGASFSAWRSRSLERDVYFRSAETFPFVPNGTLQVAAGSNISVEIRTDLRVPRQAYTVTVSSSGQVQAN